VVAAEVVDVVGRVVEVDGVAALAPGDDRDVVDAALADREREHVRVPEGEVGGVVGPEADAGDHDLGRVRVGLDERDDLVQDPVLVAAVLLGPLLEREPVVVPAAGVEACRRRRP
jgi:hypothetical protein